MSSSRCLEELPNGLKFRIALACAFRDERVRMVVDGRLGVGAISSPNSRRRSCLPLTPAFELKSTSLCSRNLLHRDCVYVACLMEDPGLGWLAALPLQFIGSPIYLPTQECNVRRKRKT